MSQVTVFFVDAGTGETFARGDMPARPFEPATTVQIGEESWQIERAEFVSASRVVLTVRKLMTIPPGDILYSLPSIVDELPPPGPGHSRSASLDLHEDDWRQVELVSRSLAARVAAEFDEIQRIYDEQGSRDASGRLIGFRRIHLRSLTALVTPVPWPGRDAGEVRLGGTPVANSFAHNLGGAWCYGMAGPSGATVVGLHPNATPVAASLRPLLAEHDLLLVDWCRRTVH